MRLRKGMNLLGLAGTDEVLWIRAGPRGQHSTHPNRTGGGSQRRKFGNVIGINGMSDADAD